MNGMDRVILSTPAGHHFGLVDLKQTREWLASRGGGETILTRANNTGMRVLEKG
jgi:hypothetical protein